MNQRVVVLGASTNPARYSNIAINMLVDYGHEVLAVGLREGEVKGIKIQTGTPTFEDVDTLTLYIGPKNQPQFYEYITQMAPSRVIFNPGTENPELMSKLRENNIEVEIACTLVLLRTQQFELA